MSSVPERPDDVADERAVAFDDVVAMLRVIARRRQGEADGPEAVAALDQAYDFIADIGRRARAKREAAAPIEPATSVEPSPPAPKPKRTRRPSPSKLAKWEAAWQAEQAAAESES